MNIKFYWNDIYNTYYYNFFKKDPCKVCLVQPCCNKECFNKHKWNLYTDFGKNKTLFQIFNLTIIVYGITMIFYQISKFITYTVRS